MIIRLLHALFHLKQLNTQIFKYFDHTVIDLYKINGIYIIRT